MSRHFYSDWTRERTKRGRKIRYGSPVHPTPTKGDGKIRENNRISGEQVASGDYDSPRKKAACKQCGFLLDVRENDTSGGSESGQAGYGDITTSEETTTIETGVAKGETFTDVIGTQEVKKGGGCPMCGSKNSVE